MSYNGVVYKQEVSPSIIIGETHVGRGAPPPTYTTYVFQRCIKTKIMGMTFVVFSYHNCFEIPGVGGRPTTEKNSAEGR